MSDDFAGAHHFQLGGAVEEIQEQMARFQKEQMARQSQGSAPQAYSTGLPGMPGSSSLLHGALVRLGELLDEQRGLLEHLWERLGAGGILMPDQTNDRPEDIPTPPMNFPIGAVLGEYQAHVMQMNHGLRNTLERLAV